MQYSIRSFSLLNPTFPCFASSQPAMNPGYPQGQGYPGGAPQGAYQGAPPPQGAYPGAPQGYQGGPPPSAAYQGGPPPQGGYPQGPPPGGAYPPGGPPSSAGEVQVQWKGEIPEQDVDDNPNAVAAQPSAPPLEKMDSVAGYGNIGFDSGVKIGLHL